MDTQRKWYPKKSAWARAKAAECRRQAMAVPGMGAISPKSRMAAMACAGKDFQRERYWLDIADRLEARGD